MKQQNHYLIRGGVEGRERLRLLARLMQPTTLSLLERAGVAPGMTCLDAGCGGGDVTLTIAELIGLEGRVVGWDIDETKLALARREAEEKEFGNVEYRRSDISQCEAASEFDLVYSRFLLSHLSDPAGALAKIRQSTRPGGVVILEDTDFTGFFCHPPSAALRRFIELFQMAAQRRGGDANIGLRLPALFQDAGFEGVTINVVQPAGIEGEVKLILPVTMENIVDSVLAEGLADKDDIDLVIAELYELARDSRTFMSHPRVIQIWGRRPRTDPAG
jgi:SAM-dependent methyltransferase